MDYFEYSKYILINSIEELMFCKAHTVNFITYNSAFKYIKKYKKPIVINPYEIHLESKRIQYTTWYKYNPRYISGAKLLNIKFL